MQIIYEDNLLLFMDDERLWSILDCSSDITKIIGAPLLVHKCCQQLCYNSSRKQTRDMVQQCVSCLNKQMTDWPDRDDSPTPLKLTSMIGSHVGDYMKW